MKRNYDIVQIHDMIDRYFEASTSESEERELRHILATTKLLTPQIEEARAVMGFYAVTKATAGNRRKTIRTPHIAAAIAIAAVSAVAISLASGSEDVENRCIAYVGGIEITDRAHVLSIMNDELQSFGDATEHMENDIYNELSILAEGLTL